MKIRLDTGDQLFAARIKPVISSGDV